MVSFHAWQGVGGFRVWSLLGDRQTSYDKEEENVARVPVNALSFST